MGCHDEFVPPAVAEMLATYRELLAERGFDWGNEHEGAFLKVWAHIRALFEHEKWLEIGEQVWPSAVQELEVPGSHSLSWADFASLVVGALPSPLPVGVAVNDRGNVTLRRPLPYVLATRPIDYKVLNIHGDSRMDVTSVSVSAEHPDLEIDGRVVPAAAAVESGRLRLTSDAISRWTVRDERGGPWFPDDVLRKYDFHGRPFFHGNDLTVEVPAGRVVVEVARGCEFRPVSVDIDVTTDTEHVVEISPERLYDAAGRGWYGGDMHAHMNCSGDLVAAPSDAARMQEGEGLHVMNILSCNENTSLIYDKEILEEFVGRDLPWSSDQYVARFGVEFRNDMFGHMHILDPSAPPTRYNTGHRRSDEPQDWPPNAAAAEEFRGLGALVGYAHPLMEPLGEGNSIDPVFSGNPRDVQAKELVADAALGLVDALEMTGNHTTWGGLEATEFLYHRLLGCGLRLAASAGSDAIMSHSGPTVLANPVGWSRAYANLRGEPLSVRAWADAVRAGRTFATNGPWLEISVDGNEPGETLALIGAGQVNVTARVVGLGIDVLEIVGPDGVLATVEVDAGKEEADLNVRLDVREPVWIAAIARGAGHPSVLGTKVYAHTSPVWVNVDGHSITRPTDAAWCLDWLDRFETLARKEGIYTEPGQLDDLVDVINRARVVYRDICARSN